MFECVDPRIREMKILLAFACVVIGFMVLIQVGTLYLHRRTRRIAASRAGETFDDFRAEFAGREIPEDVLSAVYSKLQNWCSDSVDAFPVRASDLIGDIYGIAGEDLDDLVSELMAECGKTLPDQGKVDQMLPINTVRDLVVFLAGCENL
jgi:hypothetical protein